MRDGRIMPMENLFWIGTNGVIVISVAVFLFGLMIGSFLHLQLQAVDAVKGNLQARAEGREKQGNRYDNPDVHVSILLVYVKDGAS